jgi:hypothetical protein
VLTVLESPPVVEVSTELEPPVLTVLESPPVAELPSGLEPPVLTVPESPPDADAPPRLELPAEAVLEVPPDAEAPPRLELPAKAVLVGFVPAAAPVVMLLRPASLASLPPVDEDPALSLVISTSLKSRVVGVHAHASGHARTKANPFLCIVPQVFVYDSVSDSPAYKDGKATSSEDRGRSRGSPMMARFFPHLPAVSPQCHM